MQLAGCSDPACRSGLALLGRGTSLRGRAAYAALPLPSAAVRRLVSLGLLAFLAAGCMGGDSAAIEPSELKNLVLQQQDLPAAFTRFDEGRQARIDQPGGTLADVKRFGRQDGWKARYRRPGSSVDHRPPRRRVQGRRVRRAGRGAGRARSGPRRPARRTPSRARDAASSGTRPSSRPGPRGAAASQVRFYLVRWRHENATASMLANGFEGRFTREQALELAEKRATPSGRRRLVVGAAPCIVAHKVGV